jgi:hypothetical protein
MTWGIPTSIFLQMHVGLSLIGIATGLIALAGLLSGRLLGGWTAAFLASTVLTSVTGFPLPPFGFDPPRAVGAVSLVLLAIAVLALYPYRLIGWWRAIFIITAITALYLNCFVGVVQAFQKLPALQPLAPTQSEPPFAIAQIAVLIVFVIFGVLALRRFRPNATTRGVGAQLS